MDELINVRKMICAQQKDKNNTVVVSIEQTFLTSNLKRRTNRISTNVRIKPENWSSITHKVLSKEDDYINKNQLIHNVYLANLQPNLKIKKIKYVAEYIDDYILIRKVNGDPTGTVKEFKTCQNRIIAFEKHTGKRYKFIDINISFSNEFSGWMHSIKKYKSGTIGKTFSILRTFMNYYYSLKDEIDIEMSTVFRDDKWKKGTSSINDPHPMIGEDYNKFVSGQTLNKEQEKIRDRFLFQCSTGLRYSDAFRVNPNMIKGNRIIISPLKTRNKKHNTISIDLIYLAACILAKYENDMTKLKITNQAYNRELKSLCEKLKLKEKYTSHDGRDTFITNCINSGVDIPTILSWTGQESYEVMKRYFTINDSKKALDIRKLKIYDNNYFFGNNFSYDKIYNLNYEQYAYDISGAKNKTKYEDQLGESCDDLDLPF